LLFIVSFIWYFAEDKYRLQEQIRLVQFMSIIMLLRLPLITTLLMELSAFQVIIDTGKHLFGHFLSIILSLYLIMLFFNVLGITLYAGLVNFNQIEVINNAAGNVLYYQLNFNDNAGGLLTLFAILVSNNWNSTVAMYCALNGNNLPRLYFSCFFVISIMVLLNIVVSFVLEIYALSLEENEARLVKIEYAKQLCEWAPNQEAVEELIRKAEAYDKIMSAGSSSNVSSYLCLDSNLECLGFGRLK